MERSDGALANSMRVFLALALGLIIASGLAAQGVQQPDRPIEIQSIDALNTSEADFSPTLSPDGNRMLYNSRNGQYQDLFLAEKKQGGWTLIRNVRELNSPYNDETPFWSADGRVVLFASDRDGSMEMPADAQGRIRVSYDLYWAKVQDDGTFSQPRRIPGNFQTSDHERAPALSEDSRELYYTTWEFGDISGSKIMVAHWNGSGFGEPEALPSQINSGNQDAALVPLGKGKYVFSSRRPGGAGGWDFYVTTRSESGWSEPRQIIELNSPGNEMHLSRVDNRFYFASDRSGGKGQYDLYFTEIPRLADSSEPEVDRSPEPDANPPSETANARPGTAEPNDEQVALARNRGREDDLEGVLRNYDAAMDRAGEFESEEEYRRRIERGLELAFDSDPIERTTPKKDTLIVQDRDTGRPMSVQVKMRPYYKDEQKKRPNATLSRSDAEGTLQLPEFDSEGLELSITVPGYTPYHRVIDYRAVASGKRIVYLERAKKGESFQVNDIKFDANSAVIRDESESYLESLIDFMKQNPAVRLKIVGHTDLHGSEEYNISLSLRRALSVRNYLVYHGIQEDRLAVEGAGFSHPIVNKKGPPHDQINRRTEFVILEDGNP